jgi:uncharacterized protein (DUF433 family)
LIQEIRHGKPVIKGTRVPIDLILGSLAGGMEIDEVAGEYGIKREGVLAAIEYASTIVAKEEIKVYAYSVKFLVDADMPRSSVGIIRSFGFDGEDVRDIEEDRYDEDIRIL